MVGILFFSARRLRWFIGFWLRETSSLGIYAVVCKIANAIVDQRDQVVLEIAKQMGVLNARNESVP